MSESENIAAAPAIEPDIDPFIALPLEGGELPHKGLCRKWTIRPIITNNSIEKYLGCFLRFISNYRLKWFFHLSKNPSSR